MSEENSEHKNEPNEEEKESYEEHKHEEHSHKKEHNSEEHHEEKKEEHHEPPKEHSQEHHPEHPKPQEKPLIRLSTKEWFELLYNKNYKLLLLIPAILLILSLVYLGYSYQQTGDFIQKDITLTGGTSITVFSEQEISISQLKQHLSQTIDDFAVRELSDFRSGKQKAVIIESKLPSAELKPLLEEFLTYKLDSENSSIESTGSSLGESFYNQLRLAIAVSFILMAIVVFFIFRSIIPSCAVIISAFADIMMTLATIDLLGIKVSTAGITAILMLIGYSVDSDIMLTTRLLKRHEDTNKKLLGAFKTGITMTLTSILAILTAYLITKDLSNVLNQIFFILIVGLTFDIINTWITNVSILKWYLESKERQK